GDAGFELGSEMSSLSFHMSDFGVICPSQTSQSFNKTLAPFCGTTSDRLKRHAGLEFGVVSSAFAFHFFVCWFGLQSAPTHHNHSLASGPIFGVLLMVR
ncbi:MAG: hypothetical protein ACK57Z_07920, partial [Akkermansiaceae bacterium]